MAKNLRIRCGIPGGINRPFDSRGNMVYTPEEVAEINRIDNRRRVSGAELSALMGLIAAGNVLVSTAPELYDHAEHIGKLAQLKRLVTTYRHLMVDLNMHLDITQMNTIAGNMANAHISLSSNPVPPMVNIRLEDLLHICNRAMEQCDLCCTCTRDQSKDCLLRRAFDQVPGCKDTAKKYARKDATSCPYRGMEMEVETDD